MPHLPIAERTARGSCRKVRKPNSEPGWSASAIGTPPAVAYVSARSISASGQNVSHSWEPKYIVMWHRQHS